MPSVLFDIKSKREVQVSHVVVHRTAAGQPSYHSHTVFADELLVDLGGGVLVLADQIINKNRIRGSYLECDTEE